MKTRVLVTLGLFGALALGVAQTIPNPSFEANSFTNWPGYISNNTQIVGWTSGDTNRTGLNPAAGIPFANNGTVPDGTNVAFIQNSTGSSLSTVISNLTVGETYKVNFRVNARDWYLGKTPNLKVDIDGVNLLYVTVTAITNGGSPGPYQYFAFDFTAAATNQRMTLRNDAPATGEPPYDATVLVDNFGIALRNSGWSYAAWNDDASSGVVASNHYTHAYNFGSSSDTTINGVTFTNTGTAVTNPFVTGSFSTAGLPQVDGGSVAWGDFDNDGRLDFLLTGTTNNLTGVSQLWRNTGNGFTNVPITGLPQIAYGSVAWGDFDNDGRLDFLLTGLTNDFYGDKGAVAQLWQNTGSGFTNVPIPGLPQVYDSSVAWGDFDNDGRLDFLLTGNGVSQLWQNTGSGFTNVPIPGLPGVDFGSVAWGDFDNDGRLDFLLTGDSGATHISQLWRNTGSGFTNVPIPGLPQVGASSVAWGDFDDDGRLDFLLTGTTNSVTGLAQLWRNTGNGFTNVPFPGLPQVGGSSVAWGDFDNDGRLDFLITGYPGVSQLWRINPSVLSNAPPAVPAGLSATASGDTVALGWSAPADDHTPAAGLSYNLRIGTTPGASDVLAPMALTNGHRLLPALGNAQSGTGAFYDLSRLPPGRTYYWSVQALDSSFAGSHFAAEQQFTIAPLLINPIRLPGGAFQFYFTNQSALSFHVLASTNVALPMTNWTDLGPATSLGGGYYRFTDTNTPVKPRRFYQLRKH